MRRPRASLTRSRSGGLGTPPLGTTTERREPCWKGVGRATGRRPRSAAPGTETPLWSARRRAASFAGGRPAPQGAVVENERRLALHTPHWAPGCGRRGGDLLPKAKSNAEHDAEIAAARAKEQAAYLAWAHRVVDAEGWNRGCPSRRCRRSGCQDVSRCEPVLGPMLGALRLKLTHALLEESSLRKEAHESGEAWDRRMTLADARARGLLPPEDEEGG